MDALATEPRRPTELAAVCGCARETAQRTLAGFCNRGWVEKADGRYQLTPGGEMVYDQYRELVASVERADRLREFLTNAGENVANVGNDVLDKLTVTTAADGDPHAPIDRYLTILGDEPVADFRGIAPIVSRLFNESAEDVLGPDTEMELIIDENVLERSKSEYASSLEHAHELEQFSLRISENELDFGLLLVDGHGVVASYDDHDNMVALVDGDDEVVVDWVESLYETVREYTVPIEQKLQVE
ncbi:helix-turn-helix transcriptional regulator [Haloferax sp. S1W]|uniref:helix-turn-helix transcriptional regulator n=1 Tax=Haloferax sp. S1W TaxID=3377110 RepID=UPI0037CBA49C